MWVCSILSRPNKSSKNIYIQKLKYLSLITRLRKIEHRPNKPYKYIYFQMYIKNIFIYRENSNPDISVTFKNKNKFLLRLNEQSGNYFKWGNF